MGRPETVMTYDFADNMITLATPEAAAAGKISKRLYYDSLKQKSAETVYKNETDTGAHTSWSYEFGKVSAIYGPGISGNTIAVIEQDSCMKKSRIKTAM